MARSGLAAWFLCSSGQATIALAYFAAYLAVQSNVEIAELESTLNKIHFTIGLISPVANLIRALFVSLNQFAILCGDISNPGAIELYGGPILYLFLQIFVLFGILIKARNRTNGANLASHCTVQNPLSANGVFLRLYQTVLFAQPFAQLCGVYTSLFQQI